MNTVTGLAVITQLLATFGPPFLTWFEADDADLAAMQRTTNTRRALARATRRS